MITIDLNKRKALDVDPKAIQQINFTENTAGKGNVDTTMFVKIEELKEIISNFSQGTIAVLLIYFALVQYQYKMAQCNTLRVKFSNSQLSKLRSGIKMVLK